MNKIKIIILCACLLIAAGRAGASTVSVCNFPSGSAAEVRIYDLTSASLVVNTTATGVTERAGLGLSKSCYDYTVALTAGHAYQIDWEDAATPAHVASETLYEEQTYADAATSSRASQTSVNAIPTNPLLTTDTRLNNLNAPVGSIPTNPLLTTDARLNDLDAAISSRLAASAYTAPDNTHIGLINGVTGKLQFDGSNNVKSAPQTAATLTSAYDAAKSAASQASVNAIPTNPLLITDARLNDLNAPIGSIPTNPLLTTDTRLNYLDANISSRLAASAYTAPDNTHIGLINGVTGKIQFDSSGNVKSDPQTAIQASVSAQDKTDIENGTVILLTGSLTPGAYPAKMTVNSGQPMNIFRGDSPTIDINLPAGWNLQSPAGQAVWFAVKVAPADPDSSAIVNSQATITGPQTATITLTGAQTATVGRYWAEFSVVDASGNKLVAQQFKLNILQDVRQ
ncbi:MAG: hypothetical protein M0Z48_00610 [Nitrospiraceae bacterium]|nr:hypothetical protein [Nitrospiraceae bacterium]